MTITITTAEAKRLGGRAAGWVREHSTETVSRRGLLVADLERIPVGVRRTLCRRYGTPVVPDRGETAFWLIEGACIEEQWDGAESGLGDLPGSGYDL